MLLDLPPISYEDPSVALLPQDDILAKILKEDLDTYCNGYDVSWRTKLDFGSSTVFQRRVWQTIATIPYGEVRTYSWLAEMSGASDKSARAVANACGANPFPIILPCHRVVASNGSLGGYSSGLDWKKRLLHLERSSMVVSHAPIIPCMDAITLEEGEIR